MPIKFRERANQVIGSGFDRNGILTARDNQLPARVGEQTTSDIIFTGLQINRHFLYEAGRDIFTFFND